MAKNSFVVQLTFKGFELTYDCFFLCSIHIVFPVWNMCSKFQFAWMNISKVITRRKLKNSLSDHKISKFLWIFWCGYFEKLNVFPSKNYLVFLTIERYDKELTNIKIWDKNIVPQGGEWGPERGSFLLSF